MKGIVGDVELACEVFAMGSEPVTGAAPDVMATANNESPAVLDIEQTMPPSSRLTQQANHRFPELVRQWKEATQFTSSMTDLLMHPAYQQIIGMGPAALPLLIRELKERPDFWFWAMQAITGENPLPNAAEQTFEENVEAWLEWGKRHGF